jgi:hypothetical protein
MSIFLHNKIRWPLTGSPIYFLDIKLIKPKEAAQILMCSERTLEAWRREEKGPCYYKIEGKILYKAEDILSFIEESKVSIQ